MDEFDDWRDDGEDDGDMEHMAEVWVRVVEVGDAALRVTDGTRICWIPFSLIDDASEINSTCERGDAGDLTIPQWKAEELALV